MSTTKKAPKTVNMEDMQAALQAMIAQGKKDGMIRLSDLNALLDLLETVSPSLLQKEGEQ